MRVLRGGAQLTRTMFVVLPIVAFVCEMSAPLYDRRLARQMLGPNKRMTGEDEANPGLSGSRSRASYDGFQGALDKQSPAWLDSISVQAGVVL